ncbi:MAG: tRNA 2-thiocytidine(32) synthetase TtcA [Clostridiales bacterium]|nr:tRNA 2-thiocytidine(32) synthetase TtcA [Clostridiales bacterium]
MNKILSPLRRAVEDYGMIESGDHIAVGVSGGKDSVTLLAALSCLQSFYPKKFRLTGIMLDLGIDGFDFSPVTEFAEKMGIDLIVKETNIYKVVFDIRKEENPCSLCALLRRGALNNVAVSIGANKIALGHHADDVIETFMMNLIHEGRIGCFSPVTYLSKKDVTVIRPLIYAREREIISCVKRNSLPVALNPCPADGETQRQAMKMLLCNLEKDYIGVKKRIFGALQRSGIDGWKPTIRGRK